MGVIFQDSFTDTNGTALTAHTPDTGTGWTEEENTGSGNQEIQSNHVQSSDAETEVRHIYSAQPNPANTDYEIELTAVNASSSSTSPVFLVARFADTNNYYSAGVYGDGTFKIFKKVSGTVTQLATSSGSISDGDTIKFTVDGTSLDISKNGTSQASVTDSDLSSAGKAGFGLGNAWVSSDGITTFWHLDDFSVTELVTVITKNLSGSLSFSGNLNKVIDKTLRGTLDFSGQLNKVIDKTLRGTLTFSGSLVRDVTTLITKNLSGSLTFSGSLTRKMIPVKNLSGTLNFSGSLNISKVITKVLTGTLSFSGSLSRTIVKVVTLSGTLNFSGSLSHFFFVANEKIRNVKSWILVRFFNDE